jgi:G:T/U-mismatch repair DNA glycosylase
MNTSYQQMEVRKQLLLYLYIITIIFKSHLQTLKAFKLSMDCPLEKHQFILSWSSELPENLKTKFADSWINNEEFGYFGFIPKNPVALFLGTFPVPETKTSGFFYHSDANLFWKALSIITGSDLVSLENKLSWLSTNRIAITDILYQAQRMDKDCISRADRDLKPIHLNNILKLIEQNPTISDIFLTSGGPKSKSLSGKSAGGWLGFHFRKASGKSIKRVKIQGATLTILLKPSLKQLRLHYLITPAPQDDQLGKFLRNRPEIQETFNNMPFLKSV